VPAKELSLKMEDFLQLLAAQLQYQNPLEPLDSSRFLSQLAEFAVLQELAGLRTELQGMKEDLHVLQEVMNEEETSQALSLIGRYVCATDAHGSAQEGVVTGVRLVNGVPWLLLGEKEVLLNQVFEVRQEEAGINQSRGLER